MAQEWHVTRPGGHFAADLAGHFAWRGNRIVGTHGEQPARMSGPRTFEAKRLEQPESFGQAFLAQFQRLLEPRGAQIAFESESIPEIGKHAGGVSEEASHHPAQDRRLPRARGVAEIQEGADRQHRHFRRNPALAQEVLQHEAAQGPSGRA